MLGTITMSH
jgi:hypothetical protein